MVILPAIDIKNSTCVRLSKGEFETAEKVANCPIETANYFKDCLAQWIHVVDIDGAFNAKRVNSKTILDIINCNDLNVEVGGGIRTMEDIDFYINNGASRVILGSVALYNQDLVVDAVKKYGDKIVVGIDAKDKEVVAEGWVKGSKVNYIDLAKKMESVGVKYIIFTDVSRDGMLTGPNLKQLKSLNDSVSCKIIASGGVSNIEDIKNLIKIGVYGAICGRSIYKGTLDLKQAIDISK